jgi:hypothetical protein
MSEKKVPLFFHMMKNKWAFVLPWFPQSPHANQQDMSKIPKFLSIRGRRLPLCTLYISVATFVQLCSKKGPTHHCKTYRKYLRQSQKCGWSPNHSHYFTPVHLYSYTGVLYIISFTCLTNERPAMCKKTFRKEIKKESFLYGSWNISKCFRKKKKFFFEL